MACVDGNPHALDVVIRCAECGGEATRVELVPPGGQPVGFESWRPEDRDLFIQYRSAGKWRWIYSGIDAGNGLGDDIEEAEAARLCLAFASPITYEGVKTARLFDDAGFCAACALPYCFDHWHDPRGHDGTCPKGHWRPLDPHWSPV